MSSELFERYALLDPVRGVDEKPDWDAATASLMTRLESETGRSIPTPAVAASEASREWNGVAVAVAVFAVVVIVGVVLSVLTGGGETVPPATVAPTSSTVFDGSLDSAVDPWGLSTVDMPTNQEEVNVVFLGLPDEVNGQTRTSDEDPDHIGGVDYGLDDDLMTIGISYRDGPTTHLEWFLMMIEGPEVEATAGSLDPNGDLLWFEGTMTPLLEGGSRALALWAEPGSDIFFFVEAPTPELRSALIAAFVESAARPDRDAVADAIVEDLPPTSLSIFDRDPGDVAWIGTEFTVGIGMDWVEGEYVPVEHWVEDVDALWNAEHLPTRIIHDGDPIPVWPWHIGHYGPERPTIAVVVVGPEPNPYSLPEYNMEILGEESLPPDPTAEHHLGLWAVQEIAPGTWKVTDVSLLVRSGRNMGYGALVSTWGEFGLCRVDPSVGAHAYGYFDEPAEPVIDAYYPATVAFTVSDEGNISIVDGEMVSCVLAPDPENY